MENEKKVLLTVRDVKQYFPVKKTKLREKQRYVRANDGISLDIYAGETLGLVGESGCGKSTLGRTLLQLYPQTHGDVIYHKDGKDIDLKKLSKEEMRVLRKDLQLIFQDPYSSLNPRMTVGQIIGEGLVSHGVFKRGDPAMRDYIFKVMEDCGLATYMFGRYPHQFSGGQRQRIGIARSLALNPAFVVCDEAVSALDVSIQSQILNLLSDLKEKQNLTYLFITHDLSVVKYISDRIGVMYLGNMVELAPTEELFANTLHPYTEALLSAIPVVDEEDKRERILLEGDIPSPVNPPSGCKFHTRCRYCQQKCKEEVPEWTDVGNNHYVACHFPLHKKEG
ncbi:MAG: ATP-binding cassette domain-containing protein [Pseudoflavonifractor capillosus]|uniref:ABC transporter, ATP-binding protein n=1 Tax=Pseudoflavonifractor capillosus ATCC 29799 TaxID=411467 RepID=A6NRE6_9FIRM|nr:oligopeptide/dipeptide ABC transporter ATP-binding protein [Pseudoflavonifractor capillosus]EDN01642.1 ABC transporter, ATP-binding protein [Pseudoflavonifractor capillosus ATCC 29799]MCI5928177.1 ATP-binding cassette domain-containing protein [Pseudoflavonifractor capillosus]MDY4659858.1 oligopeptide/dipeptide ABC transporter ATP-binding protein [Pseudoflavonifractor capillosus]